jgi:hypothetical protein
MFYSTRQGKGSIMGLVIRLTWIKWKKENIALYMKLKKVSIMI